ncbi:MAG: lipoyl(octanoyl) transferase [Gammaproteobacteria bacterium]|nr:lipoyl(octanoyl) transferase [Gammaproteobacteria bacterium]
MKLKIEHKNLVDYETCVNEMKKLVESQPDYHSIWVLEHDPVFTIGISEKGIEEDKTQNPPLIKTDRGGKITYHGPGQKIFYFILSLKDLPFKPTDLTKNILQKTSETLNSYGLDNEINLKDPGIYLEKKKLASVGMRIRKNYSYHGLSINFDTNLLTFNTIKPCGLDVKACNLTDYIDISIDELTSDLIDKYKGLITKK